MKTDATQTQPYPPSGGTVAKSTSFDGIAIGRFSSSFGSDALLTIPADILVFPKDGKFSTRARFATMIKHKAAIDAAAGTDHLETHVMTKQDRFDRSDSIGWRGSRTVCGEMTKRDECHCPYMIGGTIPPWKRVSGIFHPISPSREFI